MKTKQKKLTTKLGTLLLSLCLLVGLMPVAVFAAEQPAVTVGDVYRTTRTEAVVEFTSDTTGEYYYVVIRPEDFPESGELGIDTTGEGVPCAAGETVSITVDNLTTEPYWLFLVVKSEEGIESEVKMIDIPEWDWWSLGDDWILHIESDKGIDNWNSWLETLDPYTQMRYKAYIVGVNIWKDVSNVGGGDFPANDYMNLAAYTVEEGNDYYSTEDGVLYNASKTMLVAYPGAKADTDFTVPDTVDAIDSRAFYGNTKLKNITANEVSIFSEAFMRSSIETVSFNAVNRVSEWAFSRCRNLTTFSVDSEETFVINMHSFSNCSSLTDFPFEKITSNNAYSAFSGCSALTKIQCPSVIETTMFADCTGLTEITIPATVTSIGSSAFGGCTNLVSVTFESETPPTMHRPFTLVQPNFRIHVPEGSENAYIEAIGYDFAQYILDVEVINYNLYVNNIRMRSSNLTIPCGDGTASFDPETNTLTLTNATITEYGGDYGYGGAINSGLENLTIVLVGDNVIETDGDSINTAMGCSLVITGDGTLTTNGHVDLGREPSLAYNGTNDTGDLTIDGAAVNMGTYLFVHHNISFINGANVNVAGKITANHQTTVTIDGADTYVAADGFAMGNGSQTDQTECRLVINDGNFTLRNGVSFPNPEDGDTNTYSVHCDPKEIGKIEINGGTFITQSGCKVTNIPEENITVAEGMGILQGSWEEGNIMIAASHQPALVPEVPATCTTDGTKAYYTCSHCGKAFEDENCTIEITELDTWKVIPATGHSPASGWSSDEENHWKTCTVCGAVIEDSKEAHGFKWVIDKEATETESGSKHEVCEICGYEKPPVEIPALGHTHSLIKIEGTEPTCEEAGVETYWKCETCGNLYSDEKGNNQIEAPVVIPAAGHELTKFEGKEPTCQETGSITYWKCETCGKLFSDENGTVEISGDDILLETIPHSYEGGVCTVCGEPDPDFLIGDVNMDGTVDITDVALIQLYLAKLSFDDTFSEAHADTTGDGIITIEDATYIQMIIARKKL